MISSEAEDIFRDLLSQKAESDRPEPIISSMLEFYRDERAEDCRMEADGDMLLYQWGTYDWGRGRCFDLNITRQFISQDGEDEGIFQLSASMRYAPSSELDGLGSGEQWCDSPDMLPEFEKFLNASSAAKLLSGRPCEEIEITYCQVG